MGIFERYLSLWVALCIGAGVLLGNLFPEQFSLIASLEWAHVNLVVAVLIWVMIYPYDGTGRLLCRKRHRQEA